MCPSYRRGVVALAIALSFFLAGSTAQAAPVTVTGDPAPVSWGSNHADVFVVGSDGQLWHRWWTGSGWWAWESMGRPPSGGLQGSPTAVSWGQGHIDVFARGADGGLWHRWMNNTGWFGWQRIGTWQMKGDPDAVSWGRDHIDVFARGLGDDLIHVPFVASMGGWGSWESLGGSKTTDPDAISLRPGHIDVFARGTDLKLYHRWFTGSGWAWWEKLGDWQFLSEPAPVSWGDEHIDVFASGLNHDLIHIPFFGRIGCAWCGWRSEGGYITSDPKGASFGSPYKNGYRVHHMDVFYRGGGDGLWHRWFDDGWAGSDARLAPDGDLAGGPVPVVLEKGRMDVFWRGYGGDLRVQRYNEYGGGWPGIASLDIPDRWPASTRFGGDNRRLDSASEIEAAMVYLDDYAARPERWNDFLDEDKQTLAAHDVYIRWGEAQLTEEPAVETGSYEVFDNEAATAAEVEDYIPVADIFTHFEVEPVATGSAGPVVAALAGVAYGCFRFCDDAARIGSKVVKSVKQARKPVLRGPSSIRPTLGWVRRVGSRPSASLRSSLRSDPVEGALVNKPNWAAHHIVASGSRHARLAQKVLADCGIGPNDAVNGVMLPLTESVRSADNTRRAAHRHIHTGNYYANVNATLWRNTLVPPPSGYGRCDMVRAALQQMKTMLQNGKFVH